MKAFAVTSPGLEEYAAQEITELLEVKTTIKPSVVLFEATEQQLAYLTYRAQTLTKVCSLLETMTVLSADDIIPKTDFTKILADGKTFRVKCGRQGDVPVSSQEVEPVLGGIIHDQFKGGLTVSLDNPDFTVYVYLVDDDAYIGIDYAGVDLGKREYRVFANPKSMHSHIPALLLRVAGFKGTGTILDPFCLSGEIGIEAALYATHRSPQFFSKQKLAFTRFMEFDFEKVDKELQKSKATIVVSSPHMSDVRAAQKNAKIAGIEKEIDFTRQDIEWLDIKFKKESADMVVTTVPCPSATMPERVLQKVYDDFFHQVRFVLAKKGVAAVLGKNLLFLKRCAKDVIIDKEIHFMNGKESLEIIIFKKV